MSCDAQRSNVRVKIEYSKLPMPETRNLLLDTLFTHVLRSNITDEKKGLIINLSWGQRPFDRAKTYHT